MLVLDAKRNLMLQREKEKKTREGWRKGETSREVQTRNHMRKLYGARPSDIREFFLSAL